MKIVFGVVIYNQALRWADEFFESISSQSYNDFDLLIVNDGVEKINLDKFKIGTGQTIIINSPESSTISQNRKLLLKAAKEYGYDILVSGDFDDTFSSERVLSIVDCIDNRQTFYYHNIICDNLDLFTVLPNEVTSIENILQYNYLGMSNTAIDLRKLTYEWIDSLEEVSTNVFDWYLFSRLLLDGHCGKNIPGSYTIYRQSEINIAGKQNSSTSAIRKEINVKLKQYSLLKERCEEAKMLYDSLQKIKYKGFSDEELIHEVCGYWWEKIQVKSSKLINGEDLENVQL